MKRIIFLLLMLIPATISFADQSVTIKSDFITGNQFKSLNYDGKSGYAMGFIGGVFVAPFFKAPKDELSWIEDCVLGMTDTQVVAILTKFLNENPARWHESMNVIAYAAFKVSCKK